MILQKRKKKKHDFQGVSRKRKKFKEFQSISRSMGRLSYVTVQICWGAGI